MGASAPLNHWFTATVLPYPGPATTKVNGASDAPRASVKRGRRMVFPGKGARSNFTGTTGPPVPLYPRSPTEVSVQNCDTVSQDPAHAPKLGGPPRFVSRDGRTHTRYLIGRAPAMGIIFGVIGLIIWIAIAFWPARVAGRKGHSFIGYFILSLVFFPLSIILAYAVEDRTLA